MKNKSTDQKYLTVPQVAARWGVNVDKVRKFIEVGELRGINIAQSLQTRPRYRVRAEDVAAFEDRRAAVNITSTPTISRVRRTPVVSAPSRY